MKLLFVCNQGENRSRTAKELMEKGGYETKAAGIYSDFQPLTLSLLEWADKVFVFEEHQLEYIKQNFPKMAWEKPIFNLNIPDVYGYMNEGLVELLWGKVGYWLPGGRDAGECPVKIPQGADNPAGGRGNPPCVGGAGVAQKECLWRLTGARRGRSPAPGTPAPQALYILIQLSIL